MQKEVYEFQEEVDLFSKNILNLNPTEISKQSTQILQKGVNLLKEVKDKGYGGDPYATDFNFRLEELEFSIWGMNGSESITSLIGHASRVSYFLENVAPEL